MRFTRQEIFDKVVEHLAQQKVKSAEFIEPNKYYPEDKWRCLYRGPNNTKCAFGIFIPDSAYSSDLEGATCTMLLHEVEHKASGTRWSRAVRPVEFLNAMVPLIQHAEFLRELQLVHDSKGGPDTWGFQFETIAKSHGLQFDCEAFERTLNEKAGAGQ